jgi:arginyl-tRNA--protein-N-Asp/Glu arginylyltransferase
MILLFSETQSDYSRYLYPYVVWAVPEPGERPADFFQRGFLPASPDLDRFYLCRNLRVPLAGYKLSSENRRVLRKGRGIAVECIPRAEFEVTAQRREAWKRYADVRFGAEVMSFGRLDRLLGSPVISHLLHFTDTAAGREVGTALVYLEPPAVAYYYYAFYELDYFQRNLGMFMMTTAVDTFARQGFAHLHLGTCYSERALYKTQFVGVEFCNGAGWSTDLDELKFLVRREQSSAATHLLNDPDYLPRFHAGTLAHLARQPQFRLAPGSDLHR